MTNRARDSKPWTSKPWTSKPWTSKPWTSKPWTLRRRLIVGIVALLAIVTAVIGVVSVVAMQGFLVGRLDTQLTTATERSQGAFNGNPSQGGNNPDRPPASQILALPAQREGTLAGIVSGGSVYTAAVLESSGRPLALTDGQLALLAQLPDDGVPQTVDLGSSLGSYRVVVQEVNSSGDALLVGLPLADVQATVLRLTLLIAGIGLFGIIAAAVAGPVHRSPRPPPAREGRINRDPGF